MIGLNCLLVTLAMVLVVAYVDARTLKGSINVIANKVTRVAKFSFRPDGISVITGRFKYRSTEPRGTLYLFMDTEWGELMTRKLE